MGEPGLRPGTAGDAAAVAAIWEAGWRDAHVGHVPDELVQVRTSDSFRTRAVDRVGDTTVAVVDSQVAGFVMVIPGSDEVEQVYVAAAHRGSGVAGLLLAEAERQVAAGGHRQAWLAVVVGNARAKRFYERQGWSDDGPFDHAAPVEGGSILVHCHRMVRAVG
jgi:GNAT superfamily N-acetyltransferase